MSDALYQGMRFRTFNAIDDFDREALAIETDTSFTSECLVRVFAQPKQERSLPDVLRTDNTSSSLERRSATGVPITAF